MGKKRATARASFIGARPRAPRGWTAVILGFRARTRGGHRQGRRGAGAGAGAAALQGWGARGCLSTQGGGGVWERLLLGLGRRGRGSGPWAGARWATRGGKGGFWNGWAKGEGSARRAERPAGPRRDLGRSRGGWGGGRLGQRGAGRLG